MPDTPSKTARKIYSFLHGGIEHTDLDAERKMQTIDMLLAAERAEVDELVRFIIGESGASVLEQLEYGGYIHVVRALRDKIAAVKQARGQG